MLIEMRQIVTQADIENVLVARRQLRRAQRLVTRLEGTLMAKLSRGAETEPGPLDAKLAARVRNGAVEHYVEIS
jgi:hypothetical protein